MLKFRVLIVGSGAAGYCAAERLLRFGEDDIGILTESRTAGTSRNAGSDKQTYYRISQTETDGVRETAEALSSGGCMHGDAAFIEAANCQSCFLRLAEMGVPFPRDEWGRYADYRTDGGEARRGSSAGPFTSKYMTEVLEKRVFQNGNVRLIDGALLIRIVKDGERAAGAIALQKTETGYRFLPVAADFLILATGGPAKVYGNTVYPESQTGALGVLAEAGCRLNNITEWQYGLASLKTRWNVSGSYQQVVPTYYALTPRNEKIEFLPAKFGSRAEANDAVFKKGYQWPFDSEKINGTSKIDLAVQEEILKGRRVFLDFRKNPEGFSFGGLSEEAGNYLKAAGAEGGTPIERLLKLNPRAAGFYKSRGTDLSEEPLEIAVCAQSCNGGADVDTNWETNVKNLFAAGEAGGAFGLYRPGGSALNDSQVGATRAAEHIVRQNKAFRVNEAVFEKAVEEEKEYVKKCLNSKNPAKSFSKETSLFAGAFRNLEEIERIYKETDEKYSQKYYLLPSNGYEAVKRLYKYRDELNSQRLVCKTLLETLPETGSRGGAICYKRGELLPENKKYRNFCVHTENDGVSFAPLREAPNGEKSFEVVWREYEERNRAVSD